METTRELTEAQTADILPPQVNTADTERGCNTFLTELPAAQAMTTGDEARTELFGATLQGTDAAAINQGFATLDRVESGPYAPMGNDDAIGDVFVSGGLNQGGVVGRPHGFER
jgi:hypothetical protein